MGRLFCLTIVVVVVCTPVAFSNVISWTGTSGVAPWDPSIPSDSRFSGGTSASITFNSAGGFVKVHDTDTTNSFGMVRADTLVGTSWAYQVELRVNSSNRTPLNWGAESGGEFGGNSMRLAVGTSQVGFEGNDGNSYQGGLSVGIDGTVFHKYTVIESGNVVTLYIDDSGSPAISLSVANPSSSVVNAILASSSNGGTADFDVRSFAYNAGGPQLPEPAGCIFLVVAVAGARRRRIRGVLHG